MSYTKNRCCTPTCGAARPTPGASYIVSYIASTSFASTPSTSMTGAAGRFSTGSPNTRIVCVAMRCMLPTANLRGSPRHTRTEPRRFVGGSDPRGVDGGSEAAVGSSGWECLGQRGRKGVGIPRLHEGMAVARAEDPRAASRKTATAARSASSSPLRSASPPKGGYPSVCRRVTSPSRTISGRPAATRAHDFVVGRPCLEQQARFRARTPGQRLRAACHEPQRACAAAR